MNKFVLSSLVASLIFVLSACSPTKSRLEAPEVLEKLKTGNISCNNPSKEDQGLFCEDDSGSLYAVAIYESGESWDDDLTRICIGDFESWAEGENWRAIGTELISTTQLAQALGGIVLKSIDECG